MKPWNGPEANATGDAWCGGCGEPLKRIHGTAYVACCSPAYWLRHPQAPRDTWWGELPRCWVGQSKFYLYRPGSGQ